MPVSVDQRKYGPALDQQVPAGRNVVDTATKPSKPLTGETNGPARRYASPSMADDLGSLGEGVSNWAAESAWPWLKRQGKGLYDVAGTVAGDATALLRGVPNSLYNSLSSDGRNFSPAYGIADNPNFGRAVDHLVAIPMGADRLAGDLVTGMYRLGDIAMASPAAIGNLAYSVVPRRVQGQWHEFTPTKGLPTDSDIRGALGYPALEAVLDNARHINPRTGESEEYRPGYRHTASSRYKSDDASIINGPFKLPEPVAPYIERGNNAAHRALQEALYTDPSRPELNAIENTGELAGELALNALLGGAYTPAMARRSLPLAFDTIVNAGKGSSYSATHNADHDLTGSYRDSGTPLFESMLYPSILGAEFPSYVHPTIDANFYGAGLGGLANAFDAAYRMQKLNDEKNDRSTAVGRSAYDEHMYDKLKGLRTAMTEENPDEGLLRELFTPELRDWLEEKYPGLQEDMFTDPSADEYFAPEYNPFGRAKNEIAQELLDELRYNSGRFGADAIALPAVQKLMGLPAVQSVMAGLPGFLGRGARNFSR